MDNEYEEDTSEYYYSLGLSDGARASMEPSESQPVTDHDGSADKQANVLPDAVTEAYPDPTPQTDYDAYAPYPPDIYPFYATFASAHNEAAEDASADDNQQQFNVEQQFNEQFQREQQLELLRLREWWDEYAKCLAERLERGEQSDGNRSSKP